MLGSYEGTEPYVYASYDRNDASVVANILSAAIRSGARVSFDPDRILGAQCAVAFLSKNGRYSYRVRRDLETARTLYMNMVCFYIDEYRLSEQEEKRLGFRFVRLDEESILRYGAILQSCFPADVYPGPPKKISEGN